MAPFSQTRNVSASKVVNAPLDAVLKILHDPVALINLNPLVIERHASEEDKDLYHITDRIVVMGVPFDQKYSAKFTFLPDGIDTEVKAGVGTTLNNRWRAKAVPGGTEVTEDVTMKTLFFIMPFAIDTLHKSHTALIERLAAKVEGRAPTM